MQSSREETWLVLGLMACCAACSANMRASPSAEEDAIPDASAPAPAAMGGKSAADPPAPARVSDPPPRVPITPSARDDSCAPGSFHPAGCACQVGETAECWTGPADQRHTGMCHDGKQVCVGNADAEFGEWSPCMGEVRECGMDAGMPTDECLCVPGSVAYCDEDCTVSIFCSLTATKTCQPDGSWGRCTEAPGVPNLGPALFGDGGLAGVLADAGLGGLADAGLGGLGSDAGAGWLSDAGAFVLNTGQCRHYFFGCLSLLGIPERWVGDCSQQFTCKRAPQ